MPETLTAPAAPAPAAPAAPVSQPTGDEPLVPQETAEGAIVQPVAEPAPTGEGAGAPEAAKAPEPVKEPAKPEPKPEAPPPGYRREEEFRQLQAAQDQRAARLERELKEVKQRLGSAAVEAQVEGAKRAFIARLESAQLNPLDFQSQLEQIERGIRGAVAEKERAEARESELAQANQTIQQLRVSRLNDVMDKWIADLTSKHGLDAEDQKVLATYYSSDMTASEDAYVRAGNTLAGIAERLGAARKQQAEAVKAKQSLIPPGGVQVSAGGMSDDEFMAKYAAGDINDHKRAKEIQDRRGY